METVPVMHGAFTHQDLTRSINELQPIAGCNSSVEVHQCEVLEDGDQIKVYHVTEVRKSGEPPYLLGFNIPESVKILISKYYGLEFKI